MVVGSLRRTGQPPPRTLEIWPAEATLAAYTRLPELTPLFSYLLNSTIVLAIAVPLTVLVASSTGFGVRLLPPTARRSVLLGLLAILLVPVTAVWATRFELFRLAGAIDTFVPLLAHVEARMVNATDRIEAGQRRGDPGMLNLASVGEPARTRQWIADLRDCRPAIEAAL